MGQETKEKMIEAAVGLFYTQATTEHRYAILPIGQK